MKKTLLLLASAALLLVGCAKEKFEGGQVEGMTTVSFTTSLESGAVTKAAVDGDGAAASVNRCIMEIYYGDALFTRQYAPVGTDKKATFTVQVVSNRKYTVAFWADKVDDASTETGRATDKYYTTNATGGLQAIAIKGDYLGNDDARDAFYHVGQYTVAQAGSSFGGGENDKILLKRPFAQMNVITTDWDKVASIAALKPEKVNVTLKNALVNFNAVTGEASGSQTLTYEAAVYTPAANGAEKTLSMDYLFASKDKAVIDIDWKAKKTGDTDVAHAFAAVPYQRNYRTNIKGALLTTQGQWTVEVDPIWSAPEYTHPVVIATTLEEAQAAVGPASAGTEAAGTVIVKPEAIANRTADDEKGKSYVEAKTTGITLPEGAKAIEFVLTPQSKKDVTFELPALPAENFYWYIRHEPNYPTENLNVKVSEGEETRVIIDAPNNTHVVLNDVEYEHVIAITGDNTLVIPQGIKVDKLTVKKGGVEIHGTVDALEVAPETGKNVYFRECEGLSSDVFGKIYKEGEYNYIDSWYTYELVEGKYNIYKLPVVAKIGENLYKSIEDAVAAVQANQTIEIISDIALDSPITISKSDFTINGNNHTITVSDAEFWDQYKVGGAKQGLGKVNMISVKGNNFTLKDVTLYGKDCRGVSLCTTSGGKDVLYQNVTYTGRGSGHYYGEAAGLVTFDGCKFDIHGYAVHFGGESSPEDDVVIKNCEINGWSSFGDCKSLTISDSHFGGANDEGKNGWLAVLRPYCPTTVTNCTFSDIYLHEAVTGYECIGLGTGAATTVILNGCKIVNDSKQEIDADIYSIVRDNGFDNEAAKNGSVFAFDATGNATDGFTAGTFYAINSANIKAAPSYVVSAVEGKDNIWTIDGPYEARIGQVYYTTLQAAVDAVQTGETITLLCDIKTGFYGIEQILQKDFTVDPQGHLYYASGYSIDWDHSGYYITDQNTKLLYFNGGTALYGTTAFKGETLVVPEGITDIAGNKRFAGSTTLKYVKLSSTVTKLWNRFFNKANALEKIYYKVGDEYVEGLAPYLTTIEDAVFMTCGLTSPIVIPSSMTEVPANLFQESHISSVVLPEGITAIGANAFRQIAELTEVTIPSTLQTIGNQAFRDCTNLKTINLLFETVPETIGSFTFNAVSTMFGATTPGVIYVKNQDVADALKNAFDGNALQYYSIKNYDDHSIVYYKGSKIEQ